jgi:WD40 repeat protein
MKRYLNVAVYVGFAIAIFIAAAVLSERNELLRLNSAAQEQATNARATAEAETSLRATAEAQSILARSTAEAEANLRGTAETQVMVAEATVGAETAFRATIEANAAIEEQRALAYQLASEAQLILEEQPAHLERSVLLAIEAAQRFPSAGTVQALREGLQLLPRYEQQLVAGNAVWDIAYSPDGRYLASRGEDGVILWEMENGREVARFITEAFITDFIFSPTGRYFVTEDFNGLTVWEVATGAVAARFDIENPNGSIIFSVSEQYLGVSEYLDISEPGFTHVWEIASGLERIHITQSSTDLAFSSNGNYLYAVTSNDGVQVWEIATGTKLDTPEFRGWVKFSPGNTYLFEDGLDEKRIWTLETGTFIKLDLTRSPIPTWFAFSPNEHYLATSRVTGPLRGYHFGRNIVQVWDVTTGRQIMSLEDRVFELTFSPDSQYLAFVSGHTAIVLEATTGRERFRTGYPEFISDLAFSPDGRHLAVASSGGLTIWNIALPPLDLHFAHYDSEPVDISAIDYSADGKYVVTGGVDSSVHLWDAMGGNEVIRWEQPSQIRSVAFSPNSRFVLSGGGFNPPFHDVPPSIVTLWDIMTGNEVITISHTYPVGDVTFSPDGRYFATAGLAGLGEDVRVFEASTGSELVHLLDAGTQVVFSPNGQLATVGSNNIKLWTEEGWRLFATLPNSEFRYPTFSSDGRYIFTLDVTPGHGYIVNIWETETGNKVFQIPYEYPVWRVTLSPDARFVATQSDNGQYVSVVQVWNISQDPPLLQLSQNNGTSSFAFSPDSQYLAFENAEDAITVWNLQTQQETARFGRTEDISVFRFSSDGSRLIIVGGGTDVYLWRWHPDDLIAEACTRLSRNLTPAEWNTYLGDEPYRPTCPNLHIPQD